MGFWGGQRRDSHSSGKRDVIQRVGNDVIEGHDTIVLFLDWDLTTFQSMKAILDLLNVDVSGMVRLLADSDLRTVRLNDIETRERYRGIR